MSRTGLDPDTIRPTTFGWSLIDQVATVTLDRPERKNPLTFESYAELVETFRRLAYMPDVKAIIVTGAGGNFSSGGDVHEIIGPLVAMRANRRVDDLLAFTRMTGDLVKAMRHCPQPIVAAIDGICVGAGACIALASDLRIGTPRARVAFLFVRVGLAGADMGACALLPRIIGHGRASELLFTGRTMHADEAERWGFLNRVVEPENLHAAAQVQAAALASGPTFAHAMTKKALHQEWDLSLDAAIDAEAETQALCMQTEDFAIAYEAFVQKSDPVFKGR
jgi:enoyl-CoA hydratase/carnithine racemase